MGLVCHGQLAKERPAVHELAAYYLAISLGGVLGGAFNALLAPCVFTSLAEYPLVIAIGCTLWSVFRVSALNEQGPDRKIACPAIELPALALIVFLLWGGNDIGWFLAVPQSVGRLPSEVLLRFALPAFLVCGLCRRPVSFAAGTSFGMAPLTMEFSTIRNLGLRFLLPIMREAVRLVTY